MSEAGAPMLNIMELIALICDREYVLARGKNAKQGEDKLRTS